MQLFEMPGSRVISSPTSFNVCQVKLAFSYQQDPLAWQEQYEVFLMLLLLYRGSCAYLCPQTQNLSQNMDSTVLYESKGNIFKLCKKETLSQKLKKKHAFKPNF